MATKSSSFAVEAVLPWGSSATSEHKRFESEESTKPTAEAVNRDPSFGSSLLNDNFGQRATEDDDLQALDPLKLEAEVGRTRSASAETEGESRSSPPDPLLGNPNGATQMFSNMHGVSGGIEDAPEELEVPAKKGLRHKAGLTVGAQRLGVTDWGTGSDGGQTGESQDGVPYGSFIGV